MPTAPQGACGPENHPGGEDSGSAARLSSKLAVHGEPSSDNTRLLLLFEARCSRYMHSRSSCEQEDMGSQVQEVTSQLDILQKLVAATLNAMDAD